MGEKLWKMNDLTSKQRGVKKPVAYDDLAAFQRGPNLLFDVLTSRSVEEEKFGFRREVNCL